MNTQLYLARGLIEGRAWSDQDQAILREVTLAREHARRRRRARPHARPPVAEEARPTGG